MLIQTKSGIHNCRSWQCTKQIEQLKSTHLTHPFIRGFIHDITYGKGRLSILTDNKEYLQYYYMNQLPAFFTDENGRFLPDGVYFTHTLPLRKNEAALIETIKIAFDFTYLIHIVQHEGSIQHTYSFLLKCDEHQLLFFVVNHLAQLQRFTAIYERQCASMIEYIKTDKNHLILPYSEGKLTDISDFLTSCLIRENPTQNHETLVPHAFDNQLIKLSRQQANCFQLLLRGHTAKEIALRMNISYRTIQHYTATLYERLGLKNSRELITHYAYLL